MALGDEYLQGLGPLANVEVRRRLRNGPIIPLPPLEPLPAPGPVQIETAGLDAPRYADTAKWLRDLPRGQDPVGEYLRYEDKLNSLAPVAEAAGAAMAGGGLSSKDFRLSNKVQEYTPVPPLPRVDYGHQATDPWEGSIPYNQPLMDALEQRYPGPGVYPLDSQMKQDIELSPFAVLFRKRYGF